MLGGVLSAWGNGPGTARFDFAWKAMRSPYDFWLAVERWFGDGDGAVHGSPEGTNGTMTMLECLVWVVSALWWVDLEMAQELGGLVEERWCD
jgi:hypothetical protein